MPSQWLNTIKNYITNITVEPIVALYMMAFMISTVVEQAFFVYKACMVDHKLNSTICDNISDDKYANISKQIQITVSTFHIWNDVAGHAGQIILAFFMGAWSDKRGRKLPLLMGLVGKHYYSFMIVINSMQDSWPVNYIVYTATLPMAFTGADVAIFASAFAYISDVSSQESRTMRVTILEVCYLATMPIGIALGWRDTFIIMIGALSHSIARYFYAMAESDTFFYIGGVLAAFGPIVAFSVLSVADNAIPIISGTLYCLLYNFTIHTQPNAFYFLTIATQMTVFFMIVYIHFKTTDEELIHEMDDAHVSIENQETLNQ